MDIFVGTLFVITCVLLIIVVLLQKGRGGGLGAAFGGAAGSAFGTRIGDVFTWVTIVLTALFLLLAVITNFVYRPAVEVVARPQFDPSPGQIASPTPVSISCITSETSIYYTTDGSDPTAESTLYEDPVDVQPGMTLKARSYRAEWKPSPVVEGYYGKAYGPTGAPASLPEVRSVPAAP